jgi:hypothetical protein
MSAWSASPAAAAASAAPPHCSGGGGGGADSIVACAMFRQVLVLRTVDTCSVW